MTFKAFRNAGGTAVTATDTLLATTEITAGTNLAALAETGAYCVMVRAYDALGNVSVSNQNTYTNAAGVKVAKGCATATGQRSTKLDNTVPVTAFAGIANGDWSSTDTATTATISSGMMNYFYTVTETNTGTDSISVCYYNNVSNVMTVTSYISSDAATTTCVKRIAGTGTGTNKAITTATKQLNVLTSATTGTAQIVITSQHYDAAGNTGNKVTRVVLFDATVPTASAATVPTVLLGDAPAVASFLNDGMSIGNYALETGHNTSLSTASNIATHVGQFTVGAVTGYPILRSATTATTDAINTLPYGKFLNQSVSVTAPAIQYLIRANAASTGSWSENADALLGASVGYRLYAADQAGNRTLGSTLVAPTISDAFTTAVLTAGPAQTSIAGAAGAVTSIALDGAYTYSTDYATSASAVAGSKVLSSSVRVKISYFTKHDLTSTFFNNKNTSSGWVFCTNRSSSVGGSPLMVSTSAVSESRSPQSVGVPTVTLYMPVVGGGASQVTMQSVGDATLLSSTTVVGTPGNGCGDVITSTYAITVTPTDRALQSWASGSALWVVRHTNGFASVLPMGVSISR